LVSFSDTVELLSEILRQKLDRNKLGSASGLTEKLGILRAMTIGELIESCTEIFLSHESEILDAQFDYALTDHCRFAGALKEISDLSVSRIYRAKHVVEIEASGHQILPGLLEEFCRAGEH